MNNKLLLCGAIAAGLLLTACVKKETPKEDEQEQVETTQQTEQVNQPAQAEPLEAVENNETQVPTHVEVERQETANTTTEIRREVRDAPQQKPATEAAPKAETAKVEEKPTQAAVPSKPTSAAQTEDDAVAAAIAAATPALDK
ncbi:internalin [Acinetobacter sp. ANC 4169]|uniref:internalin n=1 Tax=Acinetobacter sp. ANC 4169 TaxID=1977879 RepID=UPI000A335BEF|nr:internalin [Acinetobacter sp. ANC 4169]OTG77039.1 internalin [Acinetobacter sp. ANC 4169]